MDSPSGEYISYIYIHTYINVNIHFQNFPTMANKQIYCFLFYPCIYSEEKTYQPTPDPQPCGSHPSLPRSRCGSFCWRHFVFQGFWFAKDELVCWFYGMVFLWLWKLEKGGFEILRFLRVPNEISGGRRGESINVIWIWWLISHWTWSVIPLPSFKLKKQT